MREMDGLDFKNSADVRRGFDLVRIEAARRTAVNGAAFHGGDEHSGKARVQTELGGAGYFGEQVGAAGRLADERKVRWILQRRIGRRLKSASGGEELFKGELALRGRVGDEAGFRATFGTGNVPFGGRRGDQHFTGGTTCLAQVFIGSPN